MKKRNLTHIVPISLFGVALATSTLFAYPSNPVLRTVNNAGDNVTIRTIGDEHYRFTETSDGYLVIQDSAGVYYFADEDGAKSKIKAKNAGARTAEEKDFLNKLNFKKSHEMHRKNNPDRFKHRSGGKKANWVPELKQSSENGVPKVLPLPSAEAHANGTNRFPVVLVQGEYTTNIDSASTYAVLNQENYTSGGYTGSVKDYFKSQSSGAFVPSFDVFPIVTTMILESYKGEEDELIQKAIQVLKARSDFDATKYDSDSDGEVDAVAFLYAGSEVAGLGGFQYELQWNDVGRQDAGNGKKFNSYFIIAQDGYFSVFIHEFSHTMGLKDHYCVGYGEDNCYADYTSNEYQAPGVHYWDVMATGMYANGGMTPPSYSGFERNFMGWLQYTTLTASSEVTTIAPLTTSNTAYKIPVSGNNDEWFILENRQKKDWDAALPNHGMLIWHIDYDQSAWDGDMMNDDVDHQRVDVVEAGNLKVTGYYDGFETTHFMDDPFPGSQNVTSYGPFKSWAGTSLGIQLYNITESNSNVCFATQSGVSVNNCTTTTNSGLGSTVTSSSSNIQSSSSTIVPVTQSSSSVITATSSSSEIATTATEVTYNVDLTISDSYESVSVDISSAATVLGLTAAEISSYYSAGTLKYYAVTPAGTLDQTESSATAPGHWFDANGNVSSWGSGAAVFSELNLSAMTAKVGNYPNGVTAGTTYTVKQALVYNGKQVTITLKILVNDGSSIMTNKVIARNLIQVNFQQGSLNISSSSLLDKKVMIFDLQGHQVFGKAVSGESASINLNGTLQKGMYIVRVSHMNRVMHQQVIAIR